MVNPSYRYLSHFIILKKHWKPTKKDGKYILFRALKYSGFNLEQTHLSEIERIGKLLSIVIVAFTWCYCIGIYRNEHIKKIRILKQKRRAVSLFKYGLDLVSDYLLKSYSNSKIDRFIFLSCT